MRRPVALVVLALLGAAPAQAARLRAHLDCYLPSGKVGCPQLTDAYFASLPFLERTLDAGAADVVAGARVVGEDERGTLYRLHVQGPLASPSYARIERLPRDLSESAALLRVLGTLQLLTAPQLALEEPGTSDGRGRPVLVLGAPQALPGPQERRLAAALPGETNKAVGWYQSTSLLGSASLGDNSSLSANLRSDASYSNPAWRVRTGLTADYQRVVIKLQEVERAEENVASSAKALLARSLTGGLNVAALSRVANKTAENLNFEGRLGLGLAWDLVPFMTQQGNALGIQYVLEATHHNYVQANILDEFERTHLNHGVDLVVGLHFERLDLLGNVGVAAVIGDNRFHRVEGSLSCTYRLSKALSVSVFSTLNYRRAVLNRPKESLIDSELEQFLRGGRFSTLSLQSGLSLSYTLGNTFLNFLDQRWRQF